MDGNNEFFALLDNVVQQQRLQVLNSDGEEYSFKVLTTAQLKSIIQTVVDTSTLQTSFHNAIYEVMKQNAVDLSKPIQSFNILDKLLFIIENRIKAVSPTLFIQGEEDSYIPIDLQEIKTNLARLVLNNKELISDKVLGDETITIKVGIPLIETEQLLNKTAYSELNTDSEDPQILEEILGAAFLLEISKWVKEITVLNQTLDVASFETNQKIEMIKRIPASVIEKVIDYIEENKQKIDSCLTVSNKILPLNGTLFSVR